MEFRRIPGQPPCIFTIIDTLKLQARSHRFSSSRGIPEPREALAQVVRQIRRGMPGLG